MGKIGWYGKRVSGRARPRCHGVNMETARHLFYQKPSPRIRTNGGAKIFFKSKFEVLG